MPAGAIEGEGNAKLSWMVINVFLFVYIFKRWRLAVLPRLDSKSWLKGSSRLGLRSSWDVTTPGCLWTLLVFGSSEWFLRSSKSLEPISRQE